jgi:hypothetical protein
VRGWRGRRASKVGGREDTCLKSACFAAQPSGTKCRALRSGGAASKWPPSFASTVPTVGFARACAHAARSASQAFKTELQQLQLAKGTDERRKVRMLGRGGVKSAPTRMNPRVAVCARVARPAARGHERPPHPTFPYRPWLARHLRHVLFARRHTLSLPPFYRTGHVCSGILFRAGPLRSLAFRPNPTLLSCEIRTVARAW